MCADKVNKAREAQEKWNDIAADINSLSNLEKMLLYAMLQSKSINLSQIHNKVESLQIQE